MRRTCATRVVLSLLLLTWATGRARGGFLDGRAKQCPAGPVADAEHYDPDEEAEPKAPPCRLPSATPAQRVILVGVGKGEAVADTTIAGPDEVTTTVRVVVDAGTPPLYVILSSRDPIIWRFEGAVWSIARLVFVGRSAQGATGIRPEHVLDLTTRVGSARDVECFAGFDDVGSVEGVAARDVVERTLGQPPHVSRGTRLVETLRLPAAAVARAGRSSAGAAPAGFDARVWSDFLGFVPGGLFEVNPSSVVSSAKAEHYEVLPHRAGLARLVASGAVQALESGRPWISNFRIVGTIPRFPPGLFGALHAHFILAAGVPVPSGNPGHSCVWSEEIRRPVAGECPPELWAQSGR